MTDLIETVFTTDYELFEGSQEKPLPKGVIAEVKFKTIQMGDRLNRNGRVYPWKTLSEQAKIFHESAVKTRTAVILDGHPQPEKIGEDRPSKVSGYIAEYEVDDEAAEIKNARYHLVDTRVGRDALAIARAGIPLGTSSRAGGSMSEGKYTGKFGEVTGQIIGEDMKLRGFDLVLNPSVSEARSSGEIREEHTSGDKMEIKNLAELREKYPDLAKELNKQVIAEMEQKFVQKLQEKEGEIRAELVEEAKPAQEQLEKKVSVLETEAKELKDKLKKKELNESEGSKEVSELRESLDESKKALTEAQEKIEKINQERGRESAKAWVYENTNGNPYAEQLRAAVLGTNEKTGGVKAGGDLAKQFAHVVAPSDIKEAEGRLTQAKTFIESLGISTSKGDSNPPSKPAGGTQGESALKVLAGLKKS